MMMTVIFPSSYFSDKAPDEEMAEGFAAVRETGLFETVLFSNEKWFERGELSWVSPLLRLWRRFTGGG